MNVSTDATVVSDSGSEKLYINIILVIILIALFIVIFYLHFTITGLSKEITKTLHIIKFFKDINKMQTARPIIRTRKYSDLTVMELTLEEQADLLHPYRRPTTDFGRFVQGMRQLNRSRSYDNICNSYNNFVSLNDIPPQDFTLSRNAASAPNIPNKSKPEENNASCEKIYYDSVTTVSCYVLGTSSPLSIGSGNDTNSED